MNRDHVRVFKALADPNRLRIIKMLSKREVCLCELREVLGLSSSTVSKHLTVLRDAELLLDSKDGRWVNFRLNDRSDNVLVRSLLSLVDRSFDDDETVRADAKNIRHVDRAVICDL